MVQNKERERPAYCTRCTYYTHTVYTVLYSLYTDEWPLPIYLLGYYQILYTLKDKSKSVETFVTLSCDRTSCDSTSSDNTSCDQNGKAPWTKLNCYCSHVVEKESL